MRKGLSVLRFALLSLLIFPVPSCFLPSTALPEGDPGPLFFSQQGFAPPTKPWCVFSRLLLPPPADNCLSGSSSGGSNSGGRLGPLGITARFFPHDPGGSPKADYKSERWLLIPEGRQRWHAILSVAPPTPPTPPLPARLLSRVLSLVQQEKTRNLSTRNSSMTLTRKPEELSSRQRKRQMKPLSRKEEFSGGSWSGSKVMRSEGAKEALPSAGGNSK